MVPVRDSTYQRDGIYYYTQISVIRKRVIRNRVPFLIVKTRKSGPPPHIYIFFPGKKRLFRRRVMYLWYDCVRCYHRSDRNQGRGNGRRKELCFAWSCIRKFGKLNFDHKLQYILFSDIIINIKDFENCLIFFSFQDIIFSLYWFRGEFPSCLQLLWSWNQWF